MKWLLEALSIHYLNFTHLNSYFWDCGSVWHCFLWSSVPGKYVCNTLFRPNNRSTFHFSMVHLKPSLFVK